MAEPAAETVELIGGGLLLRPYRGQDADVLFSAVRESIDSVGRWLPWCHAGYSQSDAEAWITHCAETWPRGEHFSFAIFDADSSAYLGGIGLNQRNRTHNFMSLGFWVRASRQRQGVAVRAARLVAGFAFATLGLTRVEVLAEIDNCASRRVAKTLGATFETVARNRLLARGQPIEAAVYSLIPTDAITSTALG